MRIVLCSLDQHLHHPGVMHYCRDHGIEVLSDMKLMQRLRRPDEGSDDQ